MSTTARRYWLKLLGKVGVKHFPAISGLGLPYVCHVGDFSGEVPFYHPRHSVEEIALMAAWCRDLKEPVIFDVGANNGYISTQLVQLLRKQRPRIFAFEPVPSTFAQLALSVERLKLQGSVIPVCCAVSDVPGVCSLAFDPRESLFAQIRDDGLNPRGGRDTAFAAAITIDEVVSSTQIVPALLKVDVEGFELRVLRGATRLLNASTPPAILFEWNPLTMSEVKASAADLLSILGNHQFYYVSDFDGQKKPLGEQVRDLDHVDWVCNIFAVPESDSANEHWLATLAAARETLE